MTTAEQIKTLLGMKLLIKDLARFCGVSANSIRAWKDGVSCPNLVHSTKITFLYELLANKTITRRSQALKAMGKEEWE